MDEYNREIKELKNLVAKVLEKKGVLARFRAQLRASVFEAVEDQDTETLENGRFAVVGGCNDQAKALHSTKSGQLLNGLICEYLEWSELEHTLRVFLPECNLNSYLKRPELEEELGIPNNSSNNLLNNNNNDGSNSVSSSSSVNSLEKPLLLEILDSYLHHKTVQSQKPPAPPHSSNRDKNLNTQSPTNSSRTTIRSISPTTQRTPNVGIRSTSPNTTRNIRSLSPVLPRNNPVRNSREET